MIDILSIEPTVISRDLKGKYLLLYGKPKTGKTTMASRFPKNLLIAFEKGYNAIDGIKAVDVNKWSEFRQILRQLEKPEAQAMYDTITIDTTTIAYEMCEQFVCSQNGVQSIRDIPWGQGWTLVKKEFESCLRKITMLNYGLVLISHIETRKEKTADCILLSAHRCQRPLSERQQLQRVKRKSQHSERGDATICDCPRGLSQQHHATIFWRNNI